MIPIFSHLPAPLHKFRMGLVSHACWQKGFQHWIDLLVAGLRDQLVPALSAAKLLDVEDFKKKSGIDPWQPIMEVADFNSLIALSQEHQMPVYALTREIVGKGAIWDQAKANMDIFYEGFQECANKVIALTA